MDTYKEEMKTWAASSKGKLGCAGLRLPYCDEEGRETQQNVNYSMIYAEEGADISWYLQTTIFVKWRHLELMEVGSCRNWKLQAAKSLFYLVTFDWKCVYGIKYTYIQIFHFHALGWVALRVCQHQHQPRSPGAQLGKFDSTGGLHLDRAKLWVQGKYYTKNLTVHSFMALLFWLRKQPYKSLCPRRTQKDPEGHSSKKSLFLW